MIRAARDGGPSHAPSWPALAAALALHAAFVMALLDTDRALPLAGEHEGLITIQLFAPPRQALAVRPAPQRPHKRRQIQAPSRKSTPAPPAANAAQLAPAVALAAPQTVPSAGTHDQIKRHYAALIWQHIAARKRPVAHAPANVTITFSLSQSGALLSLAVTQSSGDVMVDAMALATVRAASPLPPAPAELTARDLVFVIPFEFGR